MSSFFAKVKQQKLLSVTLLLATLLVGILIGALVNTGVNAAKDVTSAAASDATPITLPQAQPVGNEFTKLAKRLEPSVVYIHSDYLVKPDKQAKKAPDDQDDDSQDPQGMLRKFFGQGDTAKPFRQEGSGTGFIVDKNGYILTNDHVIDKADRIKVRLINDDTDYRARVIGIDPESDLAVLKIDAKRSLPPVQIGNSDGTEVGDWAVAIGAPFGLQATVTAGIVSATGRDLPSLSTQQQFQHFIQTDAAINPGNSGGPLLNIRGEVIGVNTMIATRSGAYEGIGFAMPSNMAVRVYNDIIRYGRVVRGSIGVSWRPQENKDTLLAFGLDHGVIVESAPVDKPAGKAGIKEDDVILALNDKPVQDGNDLVGRVADMPIGATALLTVDRGGQRMDFKVPIAERSEVWKNQRQFSELQKKEPAAPETKSSAQAKFGIGINRLTEGDRQRMQIEKDSGVRVASVDPGSFADDIGLQEGDIILTINRQSVTSPEDVLKIQHTLKAGQPVAFRVLRNFNFGGQKQSQRIYVSGKLPSE
ncbi:MAG TPA: Do family serine endopeptidase [Bryobacteraceae bacterium]|jgi:serine protease Do|nr:Do family serine endopeptidase [Bryobacteraceae bacterium]